MPELISIEAIENKIFVIRGHKVMLDSDLAQLYEVQTRIINRDAKRNIERFPEDYAYQISNEELEFMVSQNAIPSKQHLGGALPYAFTEQGIYMLATVLKSDVAIDVNIAIMRTFTKLREFSKHYNALAKQLLGRQEGDEVKVRLPGGEKEFEIDEVKYQEIVFECH